MTTDIAIPRSAAGAWLRSLRRGAFLLVCAAARVIPLAVRRKLLRILIDTAPLGKSAAAQWPRDPRAAVVEAYAACLVEVGEERARELVQTALAKSLNLRSQMLLRWDLAARVQLDYPRAKVKLHIGSPDELSLTTLIEREPWTVRWIERYLAPGHVFYDVGANIGVFSLLAARLHGSPTRVCAFEPAFMNFESLCRNVVANACEELITPLPVALTNRSRVEIFNHAALFAGTSMHTLGAHPGAGKPDQARYRTPVLAMALDDLLRAYQLPMPNHIRIAVDGTELNVLEGAEETLRDPRLLSMLVEVWPQQTPEEQVDSFAFPFGFRRVERHVRANTRAGADIAHLLYLREA